MPQNHSSFFLIICQEFLKSQLHKDRNGFLSTLLHWCVVWNWLGKAEENIQKNKNQTNLKPKPNHLPVNTWDLNGPPGSFHL